MMDSLVMGVQKARRDNDNNRNSCHLVCLSTKAQHIYIANARLNDMIYFPAQFLKSQEVQRKENKDGKDFDGCVRHTVSV